VTYRGPIEVFEAFVGWLKTQTKISVTKGNAVSVWFLAKEFFLSEVAAECSTFSVHVDQFVIRSERVSEMERQISSFSNTLRQIQSDRLRERLKHRNGDWKVCVCNSSD
jgi:hypothetical protein